MFFRLCVLVLLYFLWASVSSIEQDVHAFVQQNTVHTQEAR